ncbi:DUF6221 family protein [Nocardia sp. NPDC059228]|uniref:DUF6221 family protein n=1 Tax=Nocardia sp. NPDC059228 TaxID=3346777 RepID=UPI0036A67834
MQRIEKFIEARLVEDETIARTAGEGIHARWAYDGDDTLSATGGEVYCPDAPRDGVYYENVTRGDEEGTVPGVQAESGHHIARHDPARVLRQCAALRAIAGRHEAKNWEWYEDSRCLRMVSGVICEECSGDIGDVLWPCDEIRALAAIWFDHPDYQQEWATDQGESKP